MPRGGARPGAGRKANPDSVRSKRKAKAAKEPKGYTAPSGEKTDDAPKNWPFGRERTQEQPAVDEEPRKSFATPLQYWEHVLADPKASDSAKHAAAFAMAPYVHAKLAPMPKKEEAKRKAGEANKSRFGSTRAPVLATANGRTV